MEDLEAGADPGGPDHVAPQNWHRVEPGGSVALHCGHWTIVETPLFPVFHPSDKIVKPRQGFDG
jgi:hypothetical protein